MHIKDVHEWPLVNKFIIPLLAEISRFISYFQDDLTGPYTSCGHGPLGESRPGVLVAGSKAHEEARKVILTKSFQRDLPRASPYGGTSICGEKNALDRIYCRKEIFYPNATCPLYAMMATMHINTLRLAEHTVQRRVLKTREIQRKYLSRKSKLEEKSSAKHLWRDLVLDEVLRNRLIALQGKHYDSSEMIADLMAADDRYECEL
ncbi:unnamed protein product [Haemonchus placei]|uniref:Uncharacterized protein n=1 Tax=Haemonchus placei TaxID=6290 RepID=A0A0N4VZ66_HAEPC|nr:unnamed protein product [Haemonchus placei]